MKKMFFLILLTIFFCSTVYLNKVNHAKAAVEDTVTLTTTVIEYLTFTITTEDNVSFGDLTPGTAICHSTGTVATVTTNSANGYTLGVHDGSDSNSPMVHTDTTTYIPDLSSGDLTTPASWSSQTGVGVGLYAADTTKESKWGTGTTVCDANNKYAKVPAATTVAHAAAGYKASADTSSWSFKLNVANTQKTGYYEGNVTFTATATLT